MNTLDYIPRKKIKSFQKRFGRVLVSVSRKSFLGSVLGGIPPKERNSASLVTELFLSLEGVDYVRTHDPLSLKQAIKIWDILNN